ncbi:MAG: OB-fold domain-containing protein [Sphingomonadales bacterium]|nr:OB-fold domain-containing protein [Sphingomonadales bacterium]
MTDPAEKAPPPPPKRPRPKLDDDNRAFWTGGKDGQLLMLKCGDCGEFTHPPRQICRHCQAENMVATPVKGTGVIDTCVVNYQPWMPGLEVPFVIARVRLDDVPGVVLTTNIVNCDPETVDFDDRVQVTFDEQDGIWFPVFEKVG